jgi:hypothetical protein
MTTHSTAWNTSKTDSLVRIAYTESMTGDSLHYSEIDERIWRGPARPIAVIRCTEFSDYSGSSVERSNHRILAGGKFQIRLISIIGSHGYQALAYDATLGPVPADEDLQEILEGTADYALIDEDDCGSLESDMEDEAWDDHGRDDFKRALVGVLDMLDDDGGEEAGHEHELPDDDSTCSVETGTTWGEFWRRLWSEGCEELNVNGGSGFVIETGSMVHFYVDDWCAKAGEDPRYPTDKPIHLILREVAKACRMTEGK